MKKKRFSLDELKVSSFITSVDNTANVKGGTSEIDHGPSIIDPGKTDVAESVTTVAGQTIVCTIVFCAEKY